MKTSSAEETKLLSFIEDTNGFSSLRSRGRRVHNEDRAIHAHGRETRHQDKWASSVNWPVAVAEPVEVVVQGTGGLRASLRLGFP